MDLKSIFGGVAIGREASGNVKPSIKGLAVRVADGNFVARDGDGLVNVSGFVFDGGDKYVYRLPVNEQQIEPGDLLITSDAPFRSLFVKSVKDGIIVGLDPQSSAVIEYVPPTNMLGVKFFVKAVSLIGSLGSGAASDLLPLLLMADGSNSMSDAGDGDNGLTTLLLMQTLGGGKSMDINKLLPLLLLKGNKSDGLESLLLLQFMGLNPGSMDAGVLGSPAHLPGLQNGPRSTNGERKPGRSESSDKA